jgi:preprotein translocase SecE subunit
MDLKVHWSVVVAGGVFVVLGFLIFMFTFGLETGLKGVDAKTHALIDMLIDTEAELAKVAWPSKEQLTRYSVAVLLFIALFGVYLLCVDYLVAVVLRVLGVLPKG